ncbi:hypothetical protein B0H15DRAFT_882625 [Mycena belliarum]|uniref:FAD/NAD(P)-binding domain-containing protein n=1 Tax=Mycena belliarum TaxID=1033014 RepID=A0AAD6XUF9_9AGAR|nr:hypothetical protein B0H15DRAFT_882625 [Mycena belliae]
MLSQILLAVPAAYSVLLVSWHLLRRHLLAKHFGVQDLPHLQSRLPEKKVSGTAVICGGSIAGLLTARVCHDHFERVLIVEAEAWVASEEGRKIDGWNQKLARSRVAQYASLHACQSFLYTGLKSLFPNIEDECRRSEIRVLGCNPRFNSSGVLFRIPFSSYKFKLPQTMYLSRSGFETFLRRLVLDKDSYPNIELVTGTVTDVLPDPADHSRLSTVVVRMDSGEQKFSAALVADCTGPARAGLKWLDRHGYGASGTLPAGKLPLSALKISFDQKLRYSSMMFRVNQAWLDRMPLPADIPNTGPIYTFLEDGVEQGRVLFALTRPDGNTFLAFVGQHETSRSLPTNLAELKVYVEGLNTAQPIPDWAFKVIDMLEEVNDSSTSVAILKIPPTTYVRYHQATNLPSNWVALGDSVMTLNPLFSEGCTKAFKGALALHNVLRAISGNTLPSNFSTKFFEEHFDKTDLMWQNTRLMDYALPRTVPLPGESLSSGSSLRWYISQLQHLAVDDEHAALVLYNSAAGLASPIDAFNPNLLMKILWKSLLSPGLPTQKKPERY